MIKPMPPLKWLNDGLLFVDILSVYFEANEIENQAYPSVVVTLFEDQHLREYLLHMHFLNDLLDLTFQEADLPLEEHRAFTLTMMVTMPFEVDPFQVDNLAYLCFELNRFQPFGAFGVSELEGVYFKHNLVQPTRKPDIKVIIEIITVLQKKIMEASLLFRAYLENEQRIKPIIEKIANFNPFTEAES